VDAKSQLKLFKTLPHLSGNEGGQVCSFSRKVLLILKLYNQAIAEDAEDDKEDNRNLVSQIHKLFIKQRNTSSAPLQLIF
jgi:hypothetical protein